MCQTVVYCNPVDAGFLSHFVLLPKTQKTCWARHATFSPKLRRQLVQMLTKSKQPADTMQLGNLDQLITASALEHPDHSGWVTEGGRGKATWAVLADMLFCVFDSPQEERPKLVRLLPGMEVRGIVYNSAKRDSLTDEELDANRNTIKNRTISGLCAHQFVIEDPVAEEVHHFGVSSQAELDHWVALLKVASTLDTDVFSDESDLEISINVGTETTCNRPSQRPPKPPRTQVNKKADSKSSKFSEYNGGIEHSPKRSVSVSSNNSDTCTVNDSPVRKYQPPSTSAKSRLDRISMDDSCIPTAEDADNANKKSALFRCSSYKEINTSDDASTQRTQPSPNKIRKFGSIEDIKKKLSKAKLKVPFSRNTQIEQYKETNGNKKSSKTRDRTRSSSLDDNSSVSSQDSDVSASKHGIGAKIAYHANNWREKMFGTKDSNGKHEDRHLAKSSVKFAGPLQQRHLLKWIKVWCVVTDGMFMSYKSHSEAGTPLWSVTLQECSISPSQDDKVKKPYVFKLSHLGARSFYFSADGAVEHVKWLSVLRTQVRYCEPSIHLACMQGQGSGHSCGQMADLTYGCGGGADTASLHSTDSSRSGHSCESMSTASSDTTTSTSHVPLMSGNTRHVPHITSPTEPPGGSWTENYLRSISITSQPDGETGMMITDDSDDCTMTMSEQELVENTANSDQDLTPQPPTVKPKYKGSHPRCDVALKQVNNQIPHG